MGKSMAHGPKILGCKKLCGAWISKIRIISLKSRMGQIKSRGYSWALVFVWWEKSTLPGHKMWGHVIYLRIGAWAMSQNIDIYTYIYIEIIVYIYLPWEKHVVTEGNPWRDNVQGQSGINSSRVGLNPRRRTPPKHAPVGSPRRSNCISKDFCKLVA